MKVLHVLRAPVGGLFRHVVDLAHGQVERGHEVGVIADSSTANALSEEKLAALEPKLSLGLSRFRIYRQPGPADIAAVWHVARRIRATGSATSSFQRPVGMNRRLSGPEQDGDVIGGE